MKKGDDCDDGGGGGDDGGDGEGDVYAVFRLG